MKRLISSFILFLLVFSAFASDGYNIELSVANVKNTPAYLAFYYNGRTYSKDSTMLDSKGNGKFSNPEKLPEGIYIIYFNPEKYFDILVGSDQNITIKTDTTDFSKNRISGATESIKFQDLVHFMGTKQQEQMKLRESYEEKKIDSLSFVAQVKKLADEVTAYQKKQIQENQKTFFGDFVRGTIPVEIPEFNELPDSLRPMARYQYSKKHYFDNVDLSDPRMLRTPYFPPRIDNFISKNVIQIPDSLVDVAVDLIEKSKGNEETFQNMTSKMINHALRSQIMGMDAMWLALADRYYFSGQATWADSSWVEDLKKEAKKIRHNLVGMQAHNLIARDSTNKIIQLNDLNNEFILVYFYEPTCGHCKKTTPVLHDSVYQKYKNLGFEVFAFYTQVDRKEWMDFVNKHNLKDWKNVWDPYRESQFWEYYDASTTPGIYLLDKDKKIVAKKIDTETLDKILEGELINRKNK